MNFYLSFRLNIVEIYVERVRELVVRLDTTKFTQKVFFTAGMTLGDARLIARVFATSNFKS